MVARTVALTNSSLSSVSRSTGRQVGQASPGSERKSRAGGEEVEVGKKGVMGVEG